MEDSVIWSPQTGFGGNGDAETHCVRDGPFAGFQPQYPTHHCLERNFVDGMNGFNYTSEAIQDLWQSSNSYDQFRSSLGSGAHKSVHNGIGGEMPTDGSSNGAEHLPRKSLNVEEADKTTIRSDILRASRSD